MESNYKEGWGAAGVREQWPYVSGGLEEIPSMLPKTVEVWHFLSVKYLLHRCMINAGEILTLFSNAQSAYSVHAMFIKYTFLDPSTP